MMVEAASGTYSSERLAYWYFRLNGFLTNEDFVVHPDRGSDQRTDADIIAVRFRHREELAPDPMHDDPKICYCGTLVNVILAEVKTGCCALNGPWTEPEKQNMERVLMAIGCFNDSEARCAASALYKSGRWSSHLVTFRLFAIGETKAHLIVPEEQQLAWDEIIDFCINRFQEYRRQKSSTGQWPEDGNKLKEAALLPDREEARREIRRLFRLNIEELPANP